MFITINITSLMYNNNFQCYINIYIIERYGYKKRKYNIIYRYA